MTASTDEAAGSPVRLVSIAHGQMGEAQDPQRRFSWSDFDALMQQTRSMQERIETLEQQQQPKDAEEGVGLLDGGEKDNGSSNERRMTVELSENAIDALLDEYEMPEVRRLCTSHMRPSIIQCTEAHIQYPQFAEHLHPTHNSECVFNPFLVGHNRCLNVLDVFSSRIQK